MASICFQTDHDILYDLDYIPKDKIWYNVYIKETSSNYEVWISEWEPKSDVSKDKYNCSFSKLIEAKKFATDLALELNNGSRLSVFT